MSALYVVIAILLATSHLAILSILWEILEREIHRKLEEVGSFSLLILLPLEGAMLSVNCGIPREYLYLLLGLFLAIAIRPISTKASKALSVPILLLMIWTPLYYLSNC